MITEALYIVEAVAFDPALGTTRVVRIANKAFTTKPSESPANQPYEVGLEQPADIERSLFASGSTRGRSTLSLGDVTILNGDGTFDYLSELAFDTRTITVRRSTVFNPSYPADFTSFVATMEQLEWGTDKITIKLRDQFYTVAAAPLQTNKFLGNNALPAGLEGTAELAGKAKPVALGVVQMAPAPCVNTSKLIYQVNDGSVNSIDGVFDRGVPITNGVRNWTSQSTGFGGSSINAAVYAGFASPLFIIAGASGKMATSPDGVTWSSRTSGFGSTVVRGLAYGNGIAVAVGDSGTLTTSSDGVTWTARTSGFGATPINGIAFGNGLFVAVGDSGKLFTSPDGITWTSRTSGFSTTSIKAVAFGARTWVAVGASAVLTTSPEAVTWTAQSSAVTAGGTATFNAIAYGAAGFVVVGSSALVMRSTDGFQWTKIAASPAAFLSLSLLSIVYGNGLYVVGANVTGAFTPIGYSDDGDTWTIVYPAILNAIPASAFGNRTFLVVDGGGNAWTSYGTTIYSSQADLLDDTKAPPLGTYGVYLAGGYFRLGGTPDGTITADCTQGATSADRTASALCAQVLARVPGAPTFNSGDLTTLAGLTSAPLGFWDFDSGATCDAVLDQITGSVGAAWYPDKSGAFRIAQFAAPSGTPALTITQNDITASTLQRIASNDQGNGIPIYQVVVQYARFYQTLTTDIAGEVSDADRANFAQEWRSVTATDLSVLIAHPSAGVLTIQSSYANAADAQAEANRQLALRKVKRDPYTLTIELNDETDALDLNSVIEIVYPRYSLSVVGSPSGAIEGGGLFRILDARPNAEAKELTLTVWGGARYKNVVDANGAYVTDSNGAFVVAEIAA